MALLRKLRECTRVGYRSAYRCRIQPKWADVDASITATGAGCSARNESQPWAVLRAILRLAYRKGHRQ